MQKFNFCTLLFDKKSLFMRANQFILKRFFLEMSLNDFAFHREEA